jgi:hypothetical protein
MGCWVLLAGMVRSSARHAYGAIVAQFTPLLLLDVPSAGATAWALSRVGQNLLGVAVMAALEILCWSAQVVASQRSQIAAALQAAQAGLAAVEAAVLGGGGGGGGEEQEREQEELPLPHLCRPSSSSAEALAGAVAALKAATAAQSTLLHEARDEPEWAPLSLVSALEPRLPEAACLAVLQSCERTAVLLGLLSSMVAGTFSSSSSSSSSRGHGLSASAQRLVEPCAPALRLLLRALRARFAALSSAAAASASSAGSARSSGGGSAPPAGSSDSGSSGSSSAVLAAAARALEATLSSTFLDLVAQTVSREADLVASSDLIAFTALAWACKALVSTADALADAVRGLECPDSAAAQRLQRRQREQEHAVGV